MEQMIEKVFEIEGKPVKMRASASIPRLYRAKFDRDIIIDMKRLESGMKNGEEPDAIDCEIFENLAFIMARHADSSNVPKTCEEWLDSFDSPLAIYESFRYFPLSSPERIFCNRPSSCNRFRQLQMLPFTPL